MPTSQNHFPDISIDPAMKLMPSGLAGEYADSNAIMRLNSDLRPSEPHYQKSHIENSQRRISSAAQSALLTRSPGESPTALILGSGNCIDIPLEEIVSDFSTTTLVDVDIASSQAAVSSLPPKLLKKVHLLQADIGGFAAPLVNSVQRLTEQHDSFRAFVPAAAAAYQALPLADHPDLGRNHAFVCSQLLMSQLGYIPLEHTKRLIGDAYGRDIFSGWPPEHVVDDLRTYSDETHDVIQRIHTSHIRHLGRLVAKTGSIHLADTYEQQVGFAGHTAGTTLIESETVTPEVKTLFDRLQPAEAWRWYPVDHVRFIVVANALSLKQS